MSTGSNSRKGSAALTAKWARLIAIVEDPRFTLGDIRVAAKLLDLVGDGDTVSITGAELARLTNQTPRNVGRAIRRLRMLSDIQVETGRVGSDSNSYRMLTR